MNPDPAGFPNSGALEEMVSFLCVLQQAAMKDTH